MKKALIATIFTLAAITGVQIWITKDRTEQKKEMEQMESTEDSSIGGGFALTDQTGKVVHYTDLRGRVMLVSFGFTHCPDICPVTVATLSKTMELLGADADKVAPVFITVDPARDTPAVMHDFLKNFDKHLIGLTGTELQIKQVADAYKIYYAKSIPTDMSGESDAREETAEVEQAAKKPAKEPAPGDADYLMDHSGYIYLMNKEGKFLRVFPYNVPEQELARSVTNALR